MRNVMDQLNMILSFRAGGWCACREPGLLPTGFWLESVAEGLFKGVDRRFQLDRDFR
jgi:hypothetical protein